jgi:hypothetical protein
LLTAVFAPAGISADNRTEITKLPSAEPVRFFYPVFPGVQYSSGSDFGPSFLHLIFRAYTAPALRGSALMDYALSVPIISSALCALLYFRFSESGSDLSGNAFFL